MSEKKLYDLLEFPVHDTKNGVLAMFQEGSPIEKPISFSFKKVLIIKDMKESDIRGGHTHHKTTQIIIAVNGSCTVTLDNGKEKETVILNSLGKGLILYPYIWHTIQDFSKETILLVLANTEYDEKEYIRNYDEFLQLTK